MCAEVNSAALRTSSRRGRSGPASHSSRAAASSAAGWGVRGAVLEVVLMVPFVGPRKAVARGGLPTACHWGQSPADP